MKTKTNQLITLSFILTKTGMNAKTCGYIVIVEHLQLEITIQIIELNQ